MLLIDTVTFKEKKVCLKSQSITDDSSLRSFKTLMHAEDIGKLSEHNDKLLVFSYMQQEQKKEGLHSYEGGLFKQQQAGATKIK